MKEEVLNNLCLYMLTHVNVNVNVNVSVNVNVNVFISSKFLSTDAFMGKLDKKNNYFVFSNKCE